MWVCDKGVSEALRHCAYRLSSLLYLWVYGCAICHDGAASWA